MQHKNIENSEPLPFTSLLDLLTVSLLFYLFTTAVSLSKPQKEDAEFRRTIQFDLATDQSTGFSLKGFSGISIEVSQGENGELKISTGDKTLDLDSLIGYLKAENPKEILIIQQPDLRHQDTITLINAIAKTGIKSFTFGYRKRS